MRLEIDSIFFLGNIPLRVTARDMQLYGESHLNIAAPFNYIFMLEPVLFIQSTSHIVL